MSTDVLAIQISYNFRALQANLDGIGHDESLVSPRPGGNCLNWVVGHQGAIR